MIEWMPKVKINYLKEIKMDFKNILNDLLKQPENDNPKFRAELVENLVRTVYNFVKTERPEGEGLDGRDGPERRGLAEVVDAAIDHKFNMLEKSLK